MERMKICVVGAGPSGLTTIKQLRDEGHDVTCFEKSQSVGGIWFRHYNDADEMKVYDGLLLTISMKLMGFSDFMVQDRKFADNVGYLRYLEAYADTFQLHESIQLGSTVTGIAKAGQDWVVTVTSAGATAEHRFEALAICTGPFHNPNMSVPYLANFEGEIVHSSRYRNNRRFQGKKVLVVGLAESGADVVREISDVAAECTLSVRSRSFLVPRLFHGRYSTDEYTFRALHYEIYLRATDEPFPFKAIFEDEAVSKSAFIAGTVKHGKAFVGAGHTSRAAKVDPPAGATNNLGDPLYPLKLDLCTENTQEHLDFINEWNRKSHLGEGNWTPKVIFCKNVSFVSNIVKGKLGVTDSAITDIRARTVHFADGTAREVDTIVLCTGFVNDFSLLGDIKVKDNNVRNLYKHSIHPDYGGRLAFMGFVRPFNGGIPICAEMQARYFALLCSGKLQLPVDLEQAIAREKKWEEQFSVHSPRHFESIPSQVLFLDSIAREIGCLPTCSNLLDDPELLVKLWFHSFNQACYRLVGPHSMPEVARKQVMSEELPGRQASLISFLSDLTGLPSRIHPKDTAYTLEPQP